MKIIRARQQKRDPYETPAWASVLLLGITEEHSIPR